MTKKPQQVAVVADSSISLPPAMLAELNVQVAPLELRFGDRTYQDGVDLDAAAFYQMLQTEDVVPTTSAPQPSRFLEAFQRASALADHILCLTLADSLSAVHESACLAMEQARETLPGITVQVVDTHTAATAEALVVMAAARAAMAGGSRDQVFATCQKVIGHVVLMAFVDTLHYLVRSGRVPRIAAWMGSVLSVKPLLELARDDVHLVARPRTRRRATERLLDLMAQRTQGQPVVVSVIHAADPQGAEQLYEQVLARFPCREVFISEFSPVLGAHTGPGLLGLAFYTYE